MLIIIFHLCSFQLACWIVCACFLLYNIVIFIPPACYFCVSTINTIMSENCDNLPILSSKKSCSCKRDSGSDPWRDVERLHAALEVERSRNHQAHRRFSLELRRQREEAREEQERVLRELTYRHEQQKTLELLGQREALVRERAAEVRCLLRWRSQALKRTENLTLRQTQEVHRQLADEITGGSAFQGLKAGCKGNGAAYRKLEELLKTLLAQSDGRQVAVLQRLQKEVEIEKSYFLCHLLEAHSGTSCVVKRSRPRSKSCVHLLPQDQNHLDSFKEGKLALFRSRSLSQTSRSDSSQPMKKKKKQDCETSPLSSSPTEDGDLLEDLPEPCSSNEGLEKCSPSRCSEDNMDDLVRTLWIFVVFFFRVALNVLLSAQAGFHALLCSKMCHNCLRKAKRVSIFCIALFSFPAGIITQIN